jgi:hypothetical protein
MATATHAKKFIDEWEQSNFFYYFRVRKRRRQQRFISFRRSKTKNCPDKMPDPTACIVHVR